MGKRYRDLVSQYSKAKRSARSVINVMASWASDDGICSKRVDGIAAECGLSLRSVQYAISALIELGEIEISESGIGRGNTPSYLLKHAKFAPLLPVSDSEKVQNSTEKVQETTGKGANFANDTIYGSSIDQGGSSSTSTSARATSALPPLPTTQPNPIDQNTLDLMKRWSKDKPQSVRVRLSAEQAAIVDAQQPMVDPPSSVQAASMLPPTVNPNRVITVDGKEPLIVPLSTWTQLMTTLLECLGTKPRVESGDHAYKKDAEFKLEFIYKMSPNFRTADGIRSILKSWEDNDWRGSSVPSLNQFFDHATLMASGKVVCERKGQQKKAPAAPIIVPEPAEPKKFVPPYLRERKGFYTQ